MSQPSFVRILLCLFILTGFITAQDEDQFINDLLSRMKLGEKVGQMSQLPLWSADDEHVLNAIEAGRVGSFLNAGDRATKEKLQRIAVEESRLGIPLIFARDVIHGYHTVMPIPLGQAASWNPELVEQGAAVAAREAFQAGIHWTFAPMLDISRDPRWGRIAESPGEDPYLGELMARAQVSGYQGGDLRATGTIAACAKHFAGYGAAEGGRDYNTTWIPENYLRNVYLRPFEAAVQEGVATVMTGFNELNGIPASANTLLLKDILRDEWGFDGLVVSDWDSMGEMIEHGYSADSAEVALQSAVAGVDMEMASLAYIRELEQLVESGGILESRIDELVGNILRIKYRLGLFENPYPPEEAAISLSKKHLEIAEQLAAESMVLLKNEQSILPFASTVGRIALIGPLADSPRDQLGTWTPDGRPEDAITPLTAFRELETQGIEVSYIQGVEHPRSVDKSGFRDAVKAARKADLAVLIVGEDQLLSGEAHTRAFIDLPGVQEELIRKVSATGTPTVVVIFAGRPITFATVEEECDAIVYAWHPGTMGGPALVKLLMGERQPVGRLPVSILRTVGQVPTYYGHKNTGRPPSPDMLGIPLGTPEDPIDYVSYYLDSDFTPHYPFGFGLSYTTFDYGEPSLSSKLLKSGDSITVSLQVTNNGGSIGTETVQLYLRDLVASVTRPVKELIGFERVTLDPGESKNVVFTIMNEDLAFWNVDLEYVTEPGDFVIMVGSSSADTDLQKLSLRFDID